MSDHQGRFGSHGLAEARRRFGAADGTTSTAPAAVQEPPVAGDDGAGAGDVPAGAEGAPTSAAVGPRGKHGRAEAARRFGTRAGAGDRQGRPGA